MFEKRALVLKLLSFIIYNARSPDYKDIDMSKPIILARLRLVLSYRIMIG